MIRNWVSHANLLEPLDTQFIAFSFLANMRAMFTIPLEVQDYEVLLLQCLNSQASEHLDSSTLQDEMKYAVNDLDGLLRIDDKRLFSDKMNCLYRENTGNPDAEAHDFKKLLYQYFWVNQKNYKDKLVSKSTKFLPTLACHLYKPSFQE